VSGLAEDSFVAERGLNGLEDEPEADESAAVGLLSNNGAFGLEDSILFTADAEESVTTPARTLFIASPLVLLFFSGEASVGRSS
jgi:hypothetical protein